MTDCHDVTKIDVSYKVPTMGTKDDDPMVDSNLKDGHNDGTVGKRGGPTHSVSKDSKYGRAPLAKSSSTVKRNPVRMGHLSSPALEGEDISEAGQMLIRQLEKFLKITKYYEDESKNLKETAARTLLQMLEVQKLFEMQAGVWKRLVLSDDSGGCLQRTELEAQLTEMEKAFKLVGRRIDESRREQAHRISQINKLENRVLRTEEEELLKEMMDKVPTQNDLEKIKELQNAMMDKRRLGKEIRRLQMEIKAINKAMENADMIISECSAIKKPRRVVIMAESDAAPNSSVRLTSNESYVRVERLQLEGAGPCEGDENEEAAPTSEINEEERSTNSNVESAQPFSEIETNKQPPQQAKVGRKKP